MAKLSEGIIDFLKKIFEGRVLDAGIFIQHWASCTLILGMAIGYISCKYSVQSQIKEIDRLQGELVDVTTDFVANSSKYNSSIRESQLQKHISMMNIELESSTTPPYDM
ncbi:MAG: hypothetical protein HUK12_06915 [Muribaculaceae bacterium]|nr:hypothetical protein [Muribaculaceae bacterium]